MSCGVEVVGGDMLSPSNLSIRIWRQTGSYHRPAGTFKASLLLWGKTVTPQCHRSQLLSLHDCLSLWGYTGQGPPLWAATPIHHAGLLCSSLLYVLHEVASRGNQPLLTPSLHSTLPGLHPVMPILSHSCPCLYTSWSHSLPDSKTTRRVDRLLPLAMWEPVERVGGIEYVLILWQLCCFSCGMAPPYPPASFSRGSLPKPLSRCLTCAFQYWGSGKYHSEEMSDSVSLNCFFSPGTCGWMSSPVGQEPFVKLEGKACDRTIGKLFVISL